MTDNNTAPMEGMNPYAQSTEAVAEPVAQPYLPPDSVDRASAPVTYVAPVAPVAVAPAETPYEVPVDPYRGQERQVPSVPPVKKNSKWDFTSLQKGFALVALVLGYLFNRFVVNDTAPGLGALVFFEVTMVCMLIYLLKEGAKLKVGNYIWMGILMVYPVSFLLIDNPVIKGFGALFMVVAVMYWIYSCAAGVGIFRQTFLSDFLMSTFAAPFKNFIAQPVAVMKPAKDAKSRVLRYVLLGLLVTVPFTAIIAALLLSSDEAFRNFIGIENIVEEIGRFIWRFIFAIPVAMIIFSVMISAVRGKDSVKVKKSSYKGGKLNHVIFVTAFVPVILLYITYFLSQFAYFTGAFSNILPEDYTYAEYARQGFFELCAVVAINIVMVLLTVLLCKKKENGHFSLPVKFVVSVLCLFSMMLVAITVAKMVMYTSAYGFTHLRIYTLWFTLVLLSLVIITMIKIFAPKFKFWNASVTAVVILFAVLSFTNIDAVIAKYNVQWYQEGKIGWMGEEALYELDQSAVKYLDVLFEDDTKVVNEVDSEYQYYYNTYYSDLEWYSEEDPDLYYDYYETIGEQIEKFYMYLGSYDNGLISFNIPDMEAQKIYDERGVEPYVEEYYEEDFVAY